MRVLTIRQPWAWAIIYAGKDIENRDWQTPFRGRFLVHADAHDGTKAEMNKAAEFIRGVFGSVPRLQSLGRGGIIGSVELVDCVEVSTSPWFFGYFGFVLANPKPLEFIPCKGQLGWWSAPVIAIRRPARGSTQANRHRRVEAERLLREAKACLAQWHRLHYLSEAIGRAQQAGVADDDCLIHLEESAASHMVFHVSRKRG